MNKTLKFVLVGVGVIGASLAVFLVVKKVALPQKSYTDTPSQEEVEP